MKKLLSLAAIAAAAFIACTVVEEPQEPVAGDPAPSVFHATLPTTKTTLDGVSTKWTGDEWITILNSGNNYAYSTTDSGSSASFTYAGYTNGEEVATAPQGIAAPSSWALYPCQTSAALSGNVVSAWVNSVQTLNPGDFSDQHPLLIARSDAEGHLAFKNATSVLKFTIAGERPTFLWLTGNGGEPLAGSLNVSWDGTTLGTTPGEYTANQIVLSDGAEEPAPLAAGTYYFTVSPAEFPGGFTLEWSGTSYQDGKVPMKKTVRPQSFAPNKIIDLGTIAQTADGTAPVASLASASTASVGTPYKLQIRCTDNLKLGVPNSIAVGLTNSAWTASYNELLDYSNATGNWTHDAVTYYTFHSDGSADWTYEWTIDFPAAGDYIVAGYVYDYAANSTWYEFPISVTGGAAAESKTVTGLADGCYDVSFTATRALSGGVVCVTASSGSNPVRMTSLQYGSGVKHVIRGVQVSGGSCTLACTFPSGTHADFSIDSDYTFTPSSPRELLLGGDYSRLNMQLVGGVTYKEGGVAKDAVDIAADNGWNIVRLRIFNDPGNSAYSPSSYMSPGFVNTADALRLAAKAKAAGLQVFLSLHYSDYWSDPLRQNVPHEWSGYSENQLKQAVYDFTKDVMQQMAAQGTTPEYISLGNETNSGMFFGGGTEGSGQSSTYFRQAGKFAAFFAEGARAVREVSAGTKIAVHLSNPQSPSALLSILNAMKTAGTDYDIIGISYYPYWTKSANMTAGDFCSLADGWATTYGKPVMIMEDGFNWNTVTYYGNAGQLVDQGVYESIYPASPENQRNFLQEMICEIKKSASVMGVLYWDPVTVRLYNWDYTYYGVTGHISEYDNGTVTQNSSLFDFSGNRLPAWDAFKYNN